MRGRLISVWCVWSLLALGSIATTAQASPPLQYVGVVENQLVSSDPERSISVARLIKDAGFNAVRVDMPWTHTQAEIINDRLRICNAAVAAADNGLTVFISLIPTKYDGSPGNPPLWSHQITRFKTTLNAYMQSLAGPNGCVKGRVSQLHFEIGNEPNYAVFWNPQYDSRKVRQAAWAYTKLLSSVYPFAKRKAAELPGSVEVDIVGGELASGHDMLGFISAMGDAQRAYGVEGPIMDTFGWHPYGLNSGDSPTTRHPGNSVVGLADYDDLKVALQDAFGYVPPILGSEYGVETAIPTGVRWLYNAGESFVTTVDEWQQSRFLKLAYAKASCNKMVGFFNFHLFDDPDLPQWQSGMYYYWDGSNQPIPKKSLYAFRQTAQDALSGAFKCG